MAGRGARLRLAAVIGALAILPAVGTLGVAAPAAYAATSAPSAATTDYPSWKDVQKAQANERATKAAIKKIRAWLVGLQAEVEKTQAEAEAAGAEYEKAWDAYDLQAATTQTLQEQADAAQAKADEAKRTAGQLLAQLGRSSGGDLTANLLGKSGSADDLLYRLGAMSKVSERSGAVYAEALRQSKAAQSLTDQAEVAKAELERLRVLAEKALKAAQEAADKAATALEAQQANKARLEAQLTVLIEKRKATVRDYNKGLAEKYGAGAAGHVSESGWARPAAGYISSPFGLRYHPIYHQWLMHNGTDIAGAGCGAPIYAAHSGTVTYAGPNGTLGNYIQIDHGDGSATGYGHIISGGILVRIGQSVAPGQNIAKIGSTGASTGCHLHFLVRVHGNLTDPVPFMRNRGIRLG